MKTALKKQPEEQNITLEHKVIPLPEPVYDDPALADGHLDFFYLKSAKEIKISENRPKNVDDPQLKNTSVFRLRFFKKKRKTGLQRNRNEDTYLTETLWGYGYGAKPINRIIVKNNPVNWVDPWGLWTVQIGLSGSGGGGAGGTAGGGFVFGYSRESGFQFGTYGVVGGGGFGGLGASGTIDLTISENTNINQLSGTALTVGGSGGEVIVGGEEINIPTGGARPSITGSIGYGGGTIIETHGFITHTWINEWTDKGCK